MLLIPCPYCGPRPEFEFRYGGHAHIRRDPAAADDQSWAEFLFVRDNPKGIMAERWRHTSGCGRFFNCLRDTISDRILVTYRIGEPRPALDHDDFGSSRSKIMNVIDSRDIEHDVVRKPVPTFRHHALAELLPEGEAPPIGAGDEVRP